MQSSTELRLKCNFAKGGIYYQGPPNQKYCRSVCVHRELKSAISCSWAGFWLIFRSIFIIISRKYIYFTNLNRSDAFPLINEAALLTSSVKDLAHDTSWSKASCVPSVGSLSLSNRSGAQSPASNALVASWVRRSASFRAFTKGRSFTAIPGKRNDKLNFNCNRVQCLHTLKMPCNIGYYC